MDLNWICLSTYQPMFSQTAEYALRAVVWLAAHDGTPLTNLEIATAAQVPPDYLSKVMQALGRGGLVQAQRGKHGGFTLSRAASEVTILEVVNAVDPLRRIHTCPLGLRSHGKHLCALHRRMDEALAHIERALGSTSIAELVEEPSPVRPLCEIGEAAHA